MKLQKDNVLSDIDEIICIISRLRLLKTSRNKILWFIVDIFKNQFYTPQGNLDTPYKLWIKLKSYKGKEQLGE